MQQYDGSGGSQSITNPNDGYNAANTVASAAANANANANYNANRGANSNVNANANSNAVPYTGASPANYYSPGYDLSDTGANANTNVKSNNANNGAGTLDGYYTAPVFEVMQPQQQARTRKRILLVEQDHPMIITLLEDRGAMVVQLRMQTRRRTLSMV